MVLSLLFSLIIKSLISFCGIYYEFYFCFFQRVKKKRRFKPNTSKYNPLFLRWDTFERLLPYSYNLTLHLYDYRPYCDPVRGKTRFYRISNIVKSDDEYCSFRAYTYRDTRKSGTKTNILHHIKFESS